MIFKTKMAVLSAIVIAWSVASASSQEFKVHFNINVGGDDHPIIKGSTNLKNGTMLFVNIKKPWLPDGQQRIARGLAACGDDCIPAMGPNNLLGATVAVRDGSFEAGPFSFKGKPFRPGVYTLEISQSVDLNTATVEEIKAMGTPLYSSKITIGPPASTTTNRGTFYRSRYFLAGFLLRAGKVCSRDARRNIDAAFALLSTRELKTISRAYPDTTRQWMEEGAEKLNTGTMNDGVDAVCNYALTVRQKAEQIVKSDQ